MTFDPFVPTRLLKLQKWFSGCITSPLEETKKGKIQKIRAKEFIAPSSALTSGQRITIYQQQYWWRLLRTLNENYPALTRLFGHTVFNLTIATPYLLKYPSKSWTLNGLGKDLPKWIEEEYREEDKSLILAVAEIEHAFEESFLSKNYPSLGVSNQEKDIEKLLNKKIYFQSHVKTFKLPFHLFLLRDALLKETVEYWEANPFPDLLQEKTYHFILYRTPHNKISWEEISEVAYRFINLLQKGTSLQKACSLFEEEEESILEEVQNHLALWLQHWMKQGLLTTRKPFRSR